ncbi:ATP synthase F1 subcomplex delta subunit [Clostridium amylolyticum]|uniref:ATP synthase subunit delta n=1 Tax=Clostridium amylolyticum TaxID=1121298 RepID=A0A1M6B959_9CLOT|nr:F0F1 ATP synthase subunit delta [Clostridium amylolyticum]SHI45255.1 ATP synthase F1 subcomplex delta subunit [Clostridium amylolyticum]
MYEYLDRRYALALYKAAEEKNKVPEFLNDLREICDIIYNNEDLQNVIKHPQISTSKKKSTFINIFKGKIDEDLLSFLLILIEKNRILYLKEKLRELEKIHLEKNNTLEANIKSVIPLEEDELEELRIKLENKYKKKIIFYEEIDKSILGGVYVRVGDDVIDGTLRSKLQEMKELTLKSE